VLVLTGPDEVRARAGTVLGTGEWLTVDQPAVDTFADVTGDHQWIHVDVERARNSQWGGTIVHGYFTLSLIGALQQGLYRIDGFGYGLNYGLNRVRFPAPLPVGSRVRVQVELTAVEDVAGDGLQLTFTNTFQRENGDKPVCVAQTLVRYYQPLNGATP
jgi:acyl dehydratase